MTDSTPEFGRSSTVERVDVAHEAAGSIPVGQPTTDEHRPHPPERAIVEHKPRQPGFWLKNLTGMEAFRYRAWRAGIMRELDEACERFIRSESREAQLVDELLAGSRRNPVESTAQYRDEWQLHDVKGPAAKESP